jgi:DNA-binding CsgD family transcriptional regulator
MEPNTGASILEEIGSLAWGSHLCLFYETKNDLLEAMVPFFRQGLENHEYCLWVSVSPLTMEEARQGLSQRIPGAERYFEEGQLELVSHTDLYLKKNAFDPEQVLQAWTDKTGGALARGYSGMRSVGNTFWLDKHLWKNFARYETRLEETVSKLKIKLLCTYALERSSAEMVLDMIQQHHFALSRRRGKWERLERSELRRMRGEIQRLNSELQRHLLNHHPETPIPVTGAPVSEELSAREQEVLQLIVLGQTNKDIAESLALSVRTVERFRSTLLKKLGLQNTTELIIYAVTHGFLKK